MTREHVWARWLRNYPAFDALVEGYRGERESRAQLLMRLDQEGRYEYYEAKPRQVATLLPFVTVAVCGACNHGWMSTLERQSQAILDPLIHGQNVTVRVEQQRTLTAWVTKCAYAYVLPYERPNVPFRPDEYRSLAQHQEPPGRCAIWMGRSFAPTAHVSMMVHPLLFYPATTDPRTLGHLPTTAANVYLAAHTVVFVAHWVPEDMADFLDEYSFADRGFTRIWPPGGDVAWPTEVVPEEVLQETRDSFSAEALSASMPLEGYEPEELQSMVDAFVAGVDPADIRRRWSRRGRIRRLRRGISRRFRRGAG